MEVRALVSAPELGSAPSSRARAAGLLERVSVFFGLGLSPRGEIPLGVKGLERALAALVTFIPPEHSGKYGYNELLPVDKDFVDYWWKLLFRYLRDSPHRCEHHGAPLPCTTQLEGSELADEEL